MSTKKNKVSPSDIGLDANITLRFSDKRHPGKVVIVERAWVDYLGMSRFKFIAGIEVIRIYGEEKKHGGALITNRSLVITGLCLLRSGERIQSNDLMRVGHLLFAEGVQATGMLAQDETERKAKVYSFANVPEPLHFFLKQIVDRPLPTRGRMRIAEDHDSN